jgi:large subunit ribosomal protein L3
MGLGLIGRKLGMTQVFSRDGEAVPVTLVKAGPCVVVQKKTQERDGYNALQLGFGERKPQKAKKPQLGHFKKASVSPFSVLREFRVDEVESFEVGQEVNVGIFEAGQVVKVTGTSKGKGFAGGVKRWGFGGGPSSHGSMFHRAPGSIGASAYPSRVLKGKRMPGHMGHSRVTVRSVEIVDVRTDSHILLLKGAVPGPRNSIVMVRSDSQRQHKPSRS